MFPIPCMVKDLWLNCHSIVECAIMYCSYVLNKELSYGMQNLSTGYNLRSLFLPMHWDRSTIIFKALQVDYWFSISCQIHAKLGF